MSSTSTPSSWLASDIAALDTFRLVKVGMAWMTIVYVLCFAAIAIFPDIRSLFMQYTLHAEVSMGQSVITLGTFVAGLIFWDIIAAFGFGLFALLFNRIK
jgi:hypothetical protein